MIDSDEGTDEATCSKVFQWIKYGLLWREAFSGSLHDQNKISLTAGADFFVTMQSLRNGQDRVACEGALQDFKHAVAVFVQRVEAGPDPAKMVGAIAGPKAA